MDEIPHSIRRDKLQHAAALEIDTSFHTEYNAQSGAWIVVGDQTSHVYSLHVFKLEASKEAASIKGLKVTTVSGGNANVRSLGAVIVGEMAEMETAGKKKAEIITHIMSTHKITKPNADYYWYRVYKK